MGEALGMVETKGLVAMIEAADAMVGLKEEGVRRIALVSGDRTPVAERVSAEIGCDDVSAECLPADKVEYVKAIRNKGYKVAVVGDGVNDAPALAAGDIGIAMGAAGSDVALETADIALMADDLETLPFAVGLSRATSRIIRQNLWASLGIVAFLIPATLFGLGIGPAVLIHEGSTLIVVFNALRLLAFQDREH